ncbi:MAG TPA: hypothetical protein VMM84_15265 [Pyrinomonadaceae bacterium]|nr:hypothetical protein [Pyrinomonadaceae bacterium]
MKEFVRRMEIPLLLMVLLAGAAFLLKMCYLSLTLNIIFGLLFLGVFYSYVRLRHQLNVPLVLLVLVFGALQVDALGNYFRMYGQPFGPLQYDEFSHLTVQMLITPIAIRLALNTLNKLGYRPSLGITSFFAGTTIFSLSALYEIIELWDELYFQGQRIWSKYDTANDLQWDLVGILLGTLLANVVLRLRRFDLSAVATRVITR